MIDDPCCGQLIRSLGLTSDSALLLPGVKSGEGEHDLNGDPEGCIMDQG